MYQLFLLIKGLNILAGKPLDDIGATETCMLMAGNTLYISVQMALRVLMNFFR